MATTTRSWLPSSQATSLRNWRYALLALLVLIGIALRLRHYSTGRSLWLDEAMLALNIIERSFGELLQPLDYAQGAPLGFLLVQKAITLIFGPSEHTLRLFPLISGLVSLLLFIKVGSKRLSFRGLFFAFSFFVLSERLVYYAGEAKQYSSDVTASLLFQLIFFSILDNRLTIRSAILAGAAGSLLITLSHPAIFSASAVGLLLLVNFIRKRRFDEAALLLLTGAFWVATIVALYFVSLKTLTQNSALTDFWVIALPPDPPTFSAVASWSLNRVRDVLGDPLGFSISSLAIAIIIAGVISLARRARVYLAGLILPLAISYIASLLSLYPLQSRLFLFAVPLLYLLVGEGLDNVTGLFSPSFTKVFGYSVALFLIASPMLMAISSFVEPEMGEDIAPVLESIQDNWSEGDLIYVYHASIPAFSYYRDSYKFNEQDYVFGEWSRDELAGYLPQLDKIVSTRNRVWILFSHVVRNGSIREADFITDYVEANGGKLQATFKATRAVTYLYLTGR